MSLLKERFPLWSREDLLQRSPSVLAGMSPEEEERWRYHMVPTAPPPPPPPPSSLTLLLLLPPPPPSPLPGTPSG